MSAIQPQATQQIQIQTLGKLKPNNEEPNELVNVIIQFAPTKGKAMIQGADRRGLTGHSLDYGFGIVDGAAFLSYIDARPAGQPFAPPGP